MEKFMNKMGYWLHELMASIPKLNQLALFFLKTTQKSSVSFR